MAGRYFQRVLFFCLIAAGVFSCSGEPKKENAKPSSIGTDSYPFFQDVEKEGGTEGSTADKSASSKEYSKAEEKSDSYTSGESGECAASQCVGFTKKGKRCRNRTKNCSGRCWRHGGD